jgi:hypothetical protein
MSFRVYSMPRAVICPCASNGPDGARVRDKRLRSCKALRHGRHGYAKFNSPVKSNITRARSRVRDFCKNRVTSRGRVRSSHTRLSSLSLSLCLSRFPMASRTKQSAPRYRPMRAAITILVAENATTRCDIHTWTNICFNSMGVTSLNPNSQC